MMFATCTSKVETRDSDPDKRAESAIISGLLVIRTFTACAGCSSICRVISRLSTDRTPWAATLINLAQEDIF